MNTQNTLDKVTRRHTAFETFAHLVGAQGGYMPSLNTRARGRKGADLRVLADAYDCAQARAASNKRALRY